MCSEFIFNIAYPFNSSMSLESESLRWRRQEGATAVQEHNESKIGKAKDERDASSD